VSGGAVGLERTRVSSARALGTEYVANVVMKGIYCGKGFEFYLCYLVGMCVTAETIAQRFDKFVLGVNAVSREVCNL